ncbi:hypothetical protein B0F90DRAFT_1698447 [Multifurca ochricompacta]|uniref:Secreted protein n=1 Tax=Multifurca ochricompacta TaxID=376703 RepID=A0AAD4QPC7_9AGAM|nr:hypothetical protein B0F90DRAFT_1698447 [Multifurca ochricompacta]
MSALWHMSISWFALLEVVDISTFRIDVDVLTTGTLSPRTSRMCVYISPPSAHCLSILPSLYVTPFENTSRCSSMLWAFISYLSPEPDLPYPTSLNFSPWHDGSSQMLPTT